MSTTDGIIINGAFLMELGDYQKALLARIVERLGAEADLYMDSTMDGLHMAIGIVEEYL